MSCIPAGRRCRRTCIQISDIFHIWKLSIMLQTSSGLATVTACVASHCIVTDHVLQTCRQVMYDGVHADMIHSSQPQAERNAAVDKFRAGVTWLLIATDLVGRGMDFLGIQTVINYDFPQSTTDYIHRVGRTGRAGRTGTAASAWMLGGSAWVTLSAIHIAPQ